MIALKVKRRRRCSVEQRLLIDPVSAATTVAAAITGIAVSKSHHASLD
jgi:hypothetical protein